MSIDEPLNVTGMEMNSLLSDILGTEEDAVYKDLEKEAEKKVLIKAMNLPVRKGTDAIIQMRFGLGQPTEKKRHRKRWQICLVISQSYISRLEKKDYAKIAPERNGEVFLKMCYNKKKKGMVI